MRYISLFSGIEACSVAWEPLGWEPVAFADFEDFPSAVLAHHYPNVPNLGDVTKVNWNEYKGKADVVVGGSPCQSFSVAGKRLGMDDPRGNLALHYARIVREVEPTWFLYENVPGLLSSDGGRDMGALIATLGDIGYGLAWRVLDAQFFGVAQRRRRVFIVGHASGDWRRAAAVLFESEGLSRNPPPRPSKGQGLASVATSSLDSRGRDDGRGRMTGEYWNGDDYAQCLTRRGGFQRMPDKNQLQAVVEPTYVGGDVAHTVHHAYARKYTSKQDTRNGLFVVEPIPIQDTNTDEKGQNGVGVGKEGDASFTLFCRNTHGVAQPVIGFNCMQDTTEHVEVVPTISTGNQQGISNNAVATGLVVRRLTPLECERLQGFPDGYTLIPWNGKGAEDCPDGLRYHALGNSMAVPVMRWIGEGIDMVHRIPVEGEPKSGVQEWL